jgi:periplasmic protein TonB
MSTISGHEQGSRRTQPRLAQRPLPAVGLPPARERRRAGAIISILIHALIILLLIGPIALHEHDELLKIEQGAGGAGPAGGGGGGHQGTGGVVEHVAFVQPAPPHTQTQPQLHPPVVPPQPVPVVKPPEPVPVTPLPPIQEQKPEIAVEAAPTVAPQVSSLVNGAGGGTGRDGSAGSGPGSGGGIGSGIGTGRGSGVGPGTGGGTQAEYPPAPVSLFVPAMPIPRNVHGVTVTATFDIDSTGRVLDVNATKTGNKNYDKALLEDLKAFEFRPGTKADGSPIRMPYQMSYTFGGFEREIR